MKWSLFSQDNEALCRQVQAKLGLSDEDFAAVRDCVENAEINWSKPVACVPKIKSWCKHPKTRVQALQFMKCCPY